MESAIRKSPRVPLTSQVIMDSEKLLGILEKLRAGLPEEMKQARWVNKENQRILADAQAKAETIIMEAKDEALRLVSNSEIVRQAKDQAAKITEEAVISAKALRTQADEYAKGVLIAMEAELTRILVLVGKAKEQMRPVEPALSLESVNQIQKTEEPQQMLIGG